MISWYDKMTLNVIHIFAFYLIKNFVGDMIICKIVCKKRNPNPIIYRIT